MNILGKVLAFMVVIAAVVASIFTAKLVQIRNSWTVKSVTSQTKYEELIPKIEKLELQIDSLKGELFRTRELWGGFWPSVPTTVQGDGSLKIDIGTDQGVRDKQLLYGFEIAPDGTIAYRGTFSVVQIQNNAASLKPNWRVSAEDAKTWQTGNWRWRNTIPSGYQETTERQLLTSLKFEETLKGRKVTLANQNELLNKANDTLKLREAELVGGEPLGKPVKVETEYKEGLVAAIEKIEEERNKVLLKVDELRRKLRKTQADIEALQTENVELVNRLPEPGRREQVTQKDQPEKVTQKSE